MSKTSIACIIVAAIVAAALLVGTFSAGKNAGREQSQLDRLDGQVQSLFQSRGELEKRVDELEHWRNHWGQGQRGATAQ